ncbi:MAG: DUF6067 family protein [Abditibacteriales bacterium]|nr:DUF6067 family protein [Abditibacteriales bacterium]MDW8365362.1 DUF6067 family protein [Abditibacteriales bacterium]
MRLTQSVSLVFVLSAVTLTLVEGEEVMKYGIGSWKVAGRGNHRALVQVAEKADAVWVHIPWRRPDPHPEEKDVRVFDAQTGEPVRNVVRVAVTNEYGDLVFQPTSGAGIYEVYYLPYDPPTAPMPGSWWKAWYHKPQETADAAWRQRNNLTPEGLQAGTWRNLPKAKVVEIQARTEFDRFDPMEVIATPEEVAQLLAKFPNQPYLLFPEDRRHPIKLFDHLPLRWIERGPRNSFEAEAQPNEFFVFQIGVYAARANIADLQMRFADLKAENGDAIPAQAMRCFNLTGVDWLGKPMRRRFSLIAGKVRPLWLGIQIPRDAQGIYRGHIVIEPKNLPVTTVALTIKVTGAVLEDCGDSESWRLSRLRWLDAKRGLEETVIPPFTPVKVVGNVTECLNRQVTFGNGGLPTSIRSNGKEILAKPMRFVVETAEGKPLRLAAVRSRVVRVTQCRAERMAESKSRLSMITVHSTMEFDGCVNFRVSLVARSDLSVRDIRLEVPLRRQVATYMMGMGKRGGYRPREWRWKWSKRADNMVWIGEVDAGLQLKLCPPQDAWQTVELSATGIPASWSNGGRGGCNIVEEGNAVLLKAYTGARVMKAGEAMDFHFRLLITPFKPIDRRHWQWRVGAESEGNLLHIHHGGKPENPWINYPFLTVEHIAHAVKTLESLPSVKPTVGSLSYPAEGNINLQRGAVHLWVRVDFDPQVPVPEAFHPYRARFNQSLLSVDFPNGDHIGFYWNIDDRGMRAYVRKGSPPGESYPMLIGAPCAGWKQGQRHVVTLSWGEQFAVFVDGQQTTAAAYRGTLATPLEGAKIRLSGSGFWIDAIKISDAPFEGGKPPTLTVDERTLLLDTFSHWETDHKTVPEKIAHGSGQVEGIVQKQPSAHGQEIGFAGQGKEQKTNIVLYYTVRELSNRVAELWALRSLGDEVFETGGIDIYNDPDAARKGAHVDIGHVPDGGQAKVGHPWLHEHLRAGYVPAWMHPFSEDEVDCAIITKGLSRWHNYYVEGLHALMRRTGMKGLYLDGIGYDRKIMQRVARVMQSVNPESLIIFHSGNDYDFLDHRVSSANIYLEHFPYLSRLWFGEGFDYNRSPDYWLIEIAGIPFGLTGEMLEYQAGGNPYRGMVYGMTGRFHPSARYLWHLWDWFGMEDAAMLGYWSPRCPVRTDREDVLATVYRKPGKALIALAHFALERSRQEAKVRPTAKPPTIDGQLGEGEWNQAAKLTNFVVMGGDRLAEQQTEVFVTHDERNLYLGFRCTHPPGELKADAKQRDASVWEDDAIEFFLQPDLDKPVYFQFIGNSRGVVADGKGTDLSWDGDWTYKARVGEGFWEGELVIPFATLGMRAPQEGDMMGFNACRDQQTPSRIYSSWSVTSSGFHDPSAFGRIVFSAAGPPTRQERALTAEGATLKVRLKIDWEALGIDKNRCRLDAPSIPFFQSSATFSPDEPIPVPVGKGWLLIVMAAN